MTGDLLDRAADDDLAIEVEGDDPLELVPDSAPEPEIEPEPAALFENVAVLPAGLVEVLPADFKLPALIKFIPNPALKVAADEAATYALGLSVAGPEGLQRADLALSALRTSLKGIEEHFQEPTAIANELHKRLTTIRGEWQASGKAAVETVGRRMYAEQRRLELVAQEERRTAQVEADRQAREAAQREAELAAKAQAPAPVVEELKRQAETATAPPVQTQTTAPTLRGSSTVTTWKARITGTPGSDDPNPEMAALTPAQRHQVFALLKGILDGSAPLAAIALDWSYLNKRAKSDKATLSIPGIEAFEEGSVRAKGARRMGTH